MQMGAGQEADDDVPQRGEFPRAAESAPIGILIVNTRGIMVEVNAQAELLFGYTRGELIGRSVGLLMPERFRSAYAAHCARLLVDSRARALGTVREGYGLRKNGAEVPIEVVLNPMHTRDGSFVLSSIVDIAERTLTKERLVETLRQRETLIREIHHRIKNNLQMVSSLLNLQAHRMSDASTREAFSQSQARVRSIALVHEKLSRASNHTRVNFSEYASELTEHLMHVLAAEQRSVICTVHRSELQISLDACVACGLVVTELVTNSMMHAFNGRAAGHVEVSLERRRDRLEMRVSDDGVGLAEDVDITKSQSLGLELVATFAKSLKAELEVRRGAGTTFILTFPER